MKSRLHHDVAYSQTLSNVPTKNQLPTIYTVLEISPKNFIGQGHRQDQRSNQGHAMMLQTYHPLANVPTKYQLPTPYGCRDNAWTRYRSRSMQQGQRSNQGHTMTLRTYNPNQCLYQVSTSYTFRVFLRFQR